jgi:ribose 5-phosphate isomerase B
MMAVGCDHAGLQLKQKIVDFLAEQGEPCRDFGVQTGEAADYPDIAGAVTEAVRSGACRRGILICGTGIGMCIAANKARSIRAALCHDTFSARMARQHNDANVLCLGARVIGEGLALDIVELFLRTPFEGGRHQRRLEMLTKLEE